jgi:hypothetical protein
MLAYFMTEYEHVGSEGAKHGRANAASILVWTLLSPRMSDFGEAEGPT